MPIELIRDMNGKYCSNQLDAKIFRGNIGLNAISPAFASSFAFAEMILEKANLGNFHLHMIAF